MSVTNCTIRNGVEMDLAISNTKLSELIGDIYQGALTGKWDDVLNQVMVITKSNKAFFFLQQLNVEQAFILEVQSNFSLCPQALLKYKSRQQEDPGYVVTKYMVEGDCEYVNAHVDIGSHRDSSFFKEIYQPLRAFYALTGLLCRDGEHESAINLNKAESDMPYSEQDIHLMNIITPHFSRAIHIFKELRLYKNYSNISKSILDQQDKAILVCDAQGTIVLSNDYAEQHLVLPSVISIRNNKIHVREHMYQKRLEFFIKQCSALAYKDIGLQETLVIEQENGDNKLITVSPLINQNAFNDIDVPCCLVTVNNQHQLNWKNVQNEFELTPKELKLIRAIYAKKKLNDLTGVFGVTYNTLRTHLQSIFKKTEVNSQTELLIKLSMFQN